MDGHIEGGWSYTIACYIIVWGSVALYALSVYTRGRRAELDAEPESEVSS